MYTEASIQRLCIQSNAYKDKHTEVMYTEPKTEPKHTEVFYTEPKPDYVEVP